MIDARNVTKIAALLDVTNNLCTIGEDSDIIKSPCLVVIGDLAADVLAGVKEFGKSRANSADAALMRLPHHCCFFVVVFDLTLVCIVLIPTVKTFQLCFVAIPNLHCANFNNLGPTVAIELATDVWHKHT